MARTRYVSYAGIGLALLTPELEERVNELLPIADFKDWDGWNFQGYDLQKLPTPTLPSAPPIRVGSLYWPSDATRPAWFHAVVNSSQLQVILNAVPDPMTPKSLVLADGRFGKTVTASMYLLPPRPISQLGLDEDGWLITLTDQRFYWHWKAGSITTKPDSWEELFDAVAEIIGISIDVDSIPSEYGSPSSKWISYLRPPATLLDSVAAQVGQRIVVDLDGTVRSVNWESARNDSDSQVEEIQVVMGGIITNASIGLYVPERVVVAFADWSSSGPDDTEPAIAPKTYTKTLASLSIPDYGPQVGVINSTGTVFADYSYLGSNDSQCSALAVVMAEDWYGWRLSNTDVSIPGIEPWVPTGWEDAIEWVASLVSTGETQDDLPIPHAPLALTRVRRGVWSDFASGHWSGDKSQGSGSGSGSSGSGSSGSRPSGSGSIGSGSSGSGSGGSGVSGSISGSHSGSGSGTQCIGVTAVNSVTCVNGVLRVTTGTLNIVNGCLAWANLSTTSQGCCSCGGSGSGSGGSTSGGGSGGGGSTSGGGSGGGGFTSGGGSGGGTVFVPCCVQPVPLVLYVTFGGALSPLGTVPVTWDGTRWNGTAGPSACGSLGGTVTVTCEGVGATWSISAFGLSQVGVTADSCNPIHISFSGTVTGSCTGAATAVVTA